MSFYQLPDMVRPLRRIRATFAEAGAKSAASGGDVDADGLLFASFCILLVGALAARFTYVSLSGYPYEPRQLAWNLGVSLLLVPAAWMMGRSGFREATLVIRIVIAFLLTVPYASEMCVAVFHTGRNNPLGDDVFASIDRVLAFDWLAYAHWFDDHPSIWTVSLIAYKSIVPQVALMPLVLAFSRQATRLYVYMAAQALGLIVVAAVACRFPAIGAYAYAHVQRADFVHPFLTADKMTSSILWLRGDLTGTLGVTNFGLVSFPSYHAFCAVLFMWAGWSTRLRWPFAIVNALMLLATPVHGSHYVIDVIAGAFVAMLAIVVARSGLRMPRLRRPALSADQGLAPAAALPSRP